VLEVAQHVPYCERGGLASARTALCVCRRCKPKRGPRDMFLHPSTRQRMSRCRPGPAMRARRAAILFASARSARMRCRPTAARHQSGLSALSFFGNVAIHGVLARLPCECVPRGRVLRPADSASGPASARPCQSRDTVHRTPLLECLPTRRLPRVATIEPPLPTTATCRCASRGCPARSPSRAAAAGSPFRPLPE
jgi:hypothetical protein